MVLGRLVVDLVNWDSGVYNLRLRTVSGKPEIGEDLNVPEQFLCG